MIGGIAVVIDTWVIEDDSPELRASMDREYTLPVLGVQFFDLSKNIVDNAIFRFDDIVDVAGRFEFVSDVNVEDVDVLINL